MIMLFVFLSFIIVYPTYSKFRTHRWEERIKGEDYMEKNCRRNLTLYGDTQEKCDSARHEAEEHPDLFALFDAFYEFGICAGTKCENSIFVWFKSPLITIIWTIMLTLVVSCFIIIYCAMKQFEIVRRPKLPLSEFKKTQ